MAEPRTIAGEINGTGTVTYELPPGLFQYVQAVRVEIDNSGGADAQPNVEISEQSGVVIADAPQAGTIPAGDTGSATWALRLTDDTSGGGGGPTVNTEWINDPVGLLIGPAGTAQMPWKHSGGDTLLDLTVPAHPKVIADGLYTFSASLTTGFTAFTAFAVILAQLFAFTGATPLGVQATNMFNPAGPASPAIALPMTVPLTAGTGVRFQVAHGDAANGHIFNLGVIVVRIA